MSESRKNVSTNEGNASTRGKAQKDKAEQAASGAAKSAGGAARSGATSASGSASKTASTAASKATSEAADQAGAAARGVRSTVADAAQGTAALGATLSEKAKAGGEVLSTVPGKALQAASTTWTVLKNRKAIAVGVGSGAVAMLAGAYALGGAQVRRGHGPLTRATGGVL
ncbi:hypothetical protein [Streptomyces flavofungini]|uniref:hypothetical protein n=1 Tax=Streptomyces flavofungini TaxID=68200 RepID=UPI0034DEC09D